MKKKRVAIVTNGAFPVPAVRGGAVEALTEMILGQNEIYKEIDLTLFSIYDPLALIAGVKYPSVHFEFIKPKQQWINLDRAFHYVADDMLKRQDHLAFKTTFQRLNFLCQTAMKLNDNDYDAVIFENQMASLWTLKYKDNMEKYRGKYYFHLHNHPAKYAKAEEMVSQAKKIICVSSFIGHAFADHIGIPYTDDRFAVLKNVVDETLFNPENVSRTDVQEIRKQLNVTNKQVVLFLGRLMEGKGVRELLEAFEKMDRPDTVLVIVGSFNFNDSTHSPYEEELDRILQRIGTDKVIFTGYVNHDMVPAYYAMADVVCMPSTCEDAAPLAVIECLRMGKPLITTTMGGIPEYANETCAVMVDNNENLPDILKEKIAYLLDHPEQRELLSENALKVSRPRTLSSYYHNLLEILES